MFNIKTVKSRVKTVGKSVAYSQTGRRLARQVLKAPEKSMLRVAIKDRGLDYTLRRVASEQLEDGLFFAKLTISNWRAFNGKSFRLLLNGELVYGNQIEPPARGFPLEYRNIVVTSDDLQKFTLDINAPFTMKIGKGAFTTPEQVKYDVQYSVEQHGDVFYSLRGNTVNPKKILITFPGFGPSTSRISYAVSYMKALTDHDLRNTLMICFQDRYLAAGSYMMVDNSGRPLYSRVKKVIDSFMTKHGVKDDNLMFFGASKGGSIAIIYAKEYPAAHLLLAVPQMSLPYYFNKPFFRDNLFRNDSISMLEQPQEALLEYFDEGRKIDYFYTNDDELSNRSIIEFARNVPNLIKYRVNGVHGAVARAALPSMLNIMRSFMSPQDASRLAIEQVRQYVDVSTTQVQIRVNNVSMPTENENWYLEGSLGQTTFRQIMSSGEPKFMKYLSPDQKLLHGLDAISDIDRVTRMTADGRTSTGILPATLESGNNGTMLHLVDKSPVILDASNQTVYNIVDNDVFNQFHYLSAPTPSGGEVLEVRLVDDLSSSVLSGPNSDTGHLFGIKIQEENNALLNLFIVRAAIDSRMNHIRIVLATQHKTPELLEQLRNLEWRSVDIIEF